MKNPMSPMFNFYPMERLQKVIAQSGVCSRRTAEQLISQGHVLVNGKKITTLGTKVSPEHDHIVVRGHGLEKSDRKTYVLYHKPRKCLVTKTDPEGRRTVYDLLPKRFHHLKTVGRLDFDTSGILILTNDGTWAHQVTHPRFHVEKVYEVKVMPRAKPRQIDRLTNGILLDGLRTHPADVKIIQENEKTTWLRMILQEGRNRQVRRMCEKVGLQVKTLVRTQFGPFKLRGIARGKWEVLKGKD